MQDAFLDFPFRFFRWRIFYVVPGANGPAFGSAIIRKECDKSVGVCLAGFCGRRVGRDDELLAEPPFAQRLQLLRGAVALLNPIRWPEPFGLVMTEALACGTPVIGFGDGAAPEIVDDGITGFLCTDEAELVAAIGRVDEIDRAACRAAAESRFSMQRMASDHEALYRRMVYRRIRDTEVNACQSRHSRGPSATSLQRRSPHPMS